MPRGRPRRPGSNRRVSNRPEGRDKAPSGSRTRVLLHGTQAFGQQNFRRRRRKTSRSQAGWIRTNVPRIPNAVLWPLSYSPMRTRVVDGACTRIGRFTASCVTRYTTTTREWSERDSNPHRPGANRTLSHLSYHPDQSINTTGRIRTCTERCLKPLPLPVGLRWRRRGGVLQS